MTLFAKNYTAIIISYSFPTHVYHGILMEFIILFSSPQLVVDNSRNADYWRELSTCLKDIDRDWADACLNKSVVLDPRHPLT